MNETHSILVMQILKKRNHDDDKKKLDGITYIIQNHSNEK